MALALVLASCTLFGRRQPAQGAAQHSRILRSRPPRPPDSAATTRRRSSGSPARTDFSAPRSRCRWTTASPTATASKSPRSSCPARAATRRAACWSTRAAPAAPATTSSRTPAPRNFSEKVRANYDLVGFDPRGVKRSAPVTCLTDQERDASRAKIYAPGHRRRAGRRPGGQQGHRRQVRARRPVRSWATSTPSAPPRTWTSCAPCVNDSKLNYLGFSYGTFLGSTYASLFPDNVGRMVLDGALDPSLSYEELTSGQAKAFEKALRAYVAHCLAGRRLPAQRHRRTTESSRSATSSPPWRQTRAAPRTAGW